MIPVWVGGRPVLTGQRRDGLQLSFCALALGGWIPPSPHVTLGASTCTRRAVLPCIHCLYVLTNWLHVMSHTPASHTPHAPHASHCCVYCLRSGPRSSLRSCLHNLLFFWRARRLRRPHDPLQRRRRSSGGCSRVGREPRAAAHVAGLRLQAPRPARPPFACLYSRSSERAPRDWSSPASSTLGFLGGSAVPRFPCPVGYYNLVTL